MFQRILVTIDLNECDVIDRTMQMAVEQVRLSGGELHLVHVLPVIHVAIVSNFFPPDATARMRESSEQRLQQLQAQYVPSDIPCHRHVAEGKTYEAIIDVAVAQGCDLIMMPSQERSQLDRVMLGSVAEKVVAYSPVHVLVIKPDSDSE